MLEHLDRVDWANLTHAYGSAEDVPAMIRALDSADAEERAAAFHAAYGNIFHQGTRYPATPHAIPFLIELASQPRPKQRDELLALVVHCVAGYFSPVFGPVHATGPIWGEAPRPMSGYGETVEILGACEDAAEAAVPLCLGLLGHGDRRVRARAVHLLAALRKFADRYEVLPRLLERFDAEDDAGIRAMHAFALTHLLPMGHDRLERIFREDAHPVVRVVAAMGCVRRHHATPEMASALVGWLSDEALGERYAALPFSSGDLAGDLGSLLRGLGGDVLSSALPALIERLSQTKGFGAEGLLAAALAGAFGDAPLPERLSPLQRELLEALAHNQAFWSIGNALNVLMERDLPSSREEMADYLGIEVKHDPVEAARIAGRIWGSFEPARALEAWRTVLDACPRDREALLNIGALLVKAGHEADAIPALQQALEVGPPDGKALFTLGGAYYAVDDLEAACAAFAQAEAHLSGDAQERARHNRITILQELGRAEEALALTAEREPQTAADFYQRGLAEVKAGRYDACIASIGRVLAEEPEHGYAHYTVACAYALTGQVDPALASIGRALAIAPELAEQIAEDPDFASLKADVRFRRLVTPQA